MYLEDSSNLDVTAEGLSQSLKSYRFIVSLNFLYDVLTTLYQLNKTLQASNIQCVFDPKSLPTSDTDLRMAKENLNY